MRQELEKRMNYLTVAIIVFILLLLSRLAYVQIIRGGHFARRAEINSFKKIFVDAPRGPIDTRDGVLLVTNKPSYVVSMYDVNEEQREKVIPQLVELLAPYELTEEKIRALIEQNFRKYVPVRLAQNVSEETVFAIDERKMELPGVMVEVQPIRDYPYGSLASYLIGSVGSITAENVDMYREAGYRLDATVGRFGLEYAYELANPLQSLRGEDGYRAVEVDSFGRLRSEGETVPAIPGNNLTLTIDFDVQQAAETAIKDVVNKLNDGSSRFPEKPNRAAAVVLDVKTGAVVAWASYPDFPPDQWTKSEYQYLWASNIPLQPYPVGSTFKPMTLMSGLLNGVVNPDEKFYCSGVYQVGATKKYCNKLDGHGDLDLEESIKVSCNVVYYQIAQRLVNEYGRGAAMDKLGEITKLFKFDHKLELDFAPGYSSVPAILPTLEQFRRYYDYTPYPGEVWSAAIGQGIVKFSPLQMAQYTAMIANGGFYYQPYVVQHIKDPSGKITFEAQPKLLDQSQLDESALQLVRDGMHEVMLPLQRPGGPGNGSAWYLFTTQPITRNGQIIEAAGKTGTAEIGRHANGTRITPHSWFVSYAPFEEPEIAVAVFVAHGRSGSQGGVPIAHAIYKAYFEGDTDTGTPIPPPLP